MTSRRLNSIAPKVFISYSWDNDDHRKWVRDFSLQLRSDGINVTLDQWHATPGDQLAEFMEKAIRNNNFILIICTPTYKRKSNSRKGGVGYEGDIMTAEVRTKKNHRKFIPILRAGQWRNAAPSWLQGKYYIDLTDSKEYARNYEELLLTLFDERPKPPPLGQRKSAKELNRPIYVGNYSHEFDPPIPSLEMKASSPIAVKLSGQHQAVSLTVNMIIDTGGDFSVIPKKIITSLEEKYELPLPYSIVDVRSFDGTQNTLKTYELNLISKDDVLVLNKLEFVAADTDFGILGRDFINQYNIMLNSRELRFEIFER